MKRIYILGAPDPEMAAIESLLREAGQTFVYAAISRVGVDSVSRVNPGNAYKATTIIGEGLGAFNDAEEVIFVECDLEGSVGVIHCDHHRVGDAGFDAGPDFYLSGSSLGQVIKILACENVLPPSWGYLPITAEEAARTGMVGDERISLRGGIKVTTWVVTKAGEKRVIPKNLLVVAAADHCLIDAYAGRCPGVGPEDVLAFRLESRSTFQGISKEELSQRIENACDKLNNFSGACYEIGGHLVADMRGDLIPELSEAGCRLGIPFLAGPLSSPDGREKFVLQAAPQEVIAGWLRGDGPEEVGDRYGSPARGFAGGYLNG